MEKKLNLPVIHLAVIIISDRAAKKQRADETIPAILDWANSKPYEIIAESIVADERPEILQALNAALKDDQVDVIMTSGGTGFAQRDITPEATREILPKLTPGIDEYLRAKGMAVTPHAALSRGISGIARNKLVVNLPGNPKAVIENLNWLAEILPHALRVLKGPVADGEHQFGGKADN